MLECAPVIFMSRHRAHWECWPAPVVGRWFDVVSCLSRDGMQRLWRHWWRSYGWEATASLLILNRRTVNQSIVIFQLDFIFIDISFLYVFLLLQWVEPRFDTNFGVTVWVEAMRGIVMWVQSGFLLLLFWLSASSFSRFVLAQISTVNVPYCIYIINDRKIVTSCVRGKNFYRFHPLIQRLKRAHPTPNPTGKEFVVNSIGTRTIQLFLMGIGYILFSYAVGTFAVKKKNTSTSVSNRICSK